MQTEIGTRDASDSIFPPDLDFFRHLFRPFPQCYHASMGNGTGGFDRNLPDELPGCGLVDVRAWNRVGQQACLNRPSADFLDEVGMLGELSGSLALGCSRGDQANHFLVLFLHQAQGIGEIGIVGDDHGAVVGIQPRIVQYVQRHIHVGALFLVLPYPDRGRRGVGVFHRNFVPQKMPVMEFDKCAMSFQCAEIGILADVHVRVMRRRLHPCGEIPDLDDLVLLAEHILEERLYVQPFPWRPLGLTVIEIESVDIDDGAVGRAREALNKSCFL